MERRLHLWKEGELTELLIEGETIQKNLSDSKRTTTIAELSKQFKNYMKKGNVNAALKLLTNNMKDGILPQNIQTLHRLKEKRPESKDTSINILLTDISQGIHSINFAGIDEEMIRKAAIKTKGGSGSSAMDPDGWRRILCSNNFGDTNVDLRKAIANFIKNVCPEEISITSIEPFVACRLIPLDKNPGLRPIGIGEILRRITGKIIVSVVKKEVISSTVSFQVCAGQEAGSEASIHAMEKIFKEESTEAVLLVDAANVFNSINRKVFLHNISIVCPTISTFVTDGCTTPARLFVIGGTEIRSNEGTTQSDPVARAIHTIGITPLVMMMVELVTTRCDDIKMVAFADDFSAAGKLISLLQWWTTLLEIGPKFCYDHEPKKSCLITKLETHTLAKEVFQTSKVKTTNSGKRYLRSALGTLSFKREYINEFVTQWISEIEVLSQIAKIEPQVAYCCFTTGFKHKVTYLMRTTSGIDEELRRLDDVINNKLIPSFTENKLCGDDERHLLSLPTKLGGMGIPIFSEISQTEFQNSSQLTEEHVSLITRQDRTYNIEKDSLKNIKHKIKLEIQKCNQQKLVNIRSKLTIQQCRLNDINIEQGASTWLTTLRIEDEGYMLHKQEFWDLVNIRYGWPLSRTPRTWEQL